MAEGSDDLSEVDEVWLGDQSVAGEEFVEALNTVTEFQDTIRELQTELNEMNVGLDEEDAVNLIWGRSSLNKTEIEGAFEVMDAIVEEDPEDVAPRLMADKASDLNIGDAAEVWQEIVDLAEKYGDSNE